MQVYLMIAPNPKDMRVDPTERVIEMLFLMWKIF
jgi:hypothetical protein